MMIPAGRAFQSVIRGLKNKLNYSKKTIDKIPQNCYWRLIDYRGNDCRRINYSFIQKKWLKQYCFIQLSSTNLVTDLVTKNKKEAGKRLKTTWWAQDLNLRPLP